jgi:C-terminal processing protease CtpA/Prc
LPVAAYLTWQGSLIEGKGVTPSVPVELPADQLMAGGDTQMQKALELVRSM